MPGKGWGSWGTRRRINGFSLPVQRVTLNILQLLQQLYCNVP